MDGRKEIERNRPEAVIPRGLEAALPSSVES